MPAVAHYGFWAWSGRPEPGPLGRLSGLRSQPDASDCSLPECEGFSAPAQAGFSSAAGRISVKFASTFKVRPAERTPLKHAKGMLQLARHLRSSAGSGS